MGPGAARQLVTFLERPRKVTKGRPPRCRAPSSRGNPVLPDSTRRLRNSTWRGTHNVPHCGTDSVPGGRELGAESESWAPVLATSSESTHLFPQTELRLTGHRCSARRKLLVESSCSARHKGKKGQATATATGLELHSKSQR